MQFVFKIYVCIFNEDLQASELAQSSEQPGTSKTREHRVHIATRD
jgi:hypothetical protein